MPSGLRALGAAALAVGQSALTVTENGTYLATVTLDAVPVNLLVDTETSGVWVKCSALESPSCATGVFTKATGYSRENLVLFDRMVPRKTRRFKEVAIAGQTFTGFDTFVVYDALPEADSSIQGILGLKKIDSDRKTAPMYLDGQVTTVALQLGQTSADSKLLLDTDDRSWLSKKGFTTVATYLKDMKCFNVPLANGSSECTSSYGRAYYDPAVPFIGLDTGAHDALVRRFLYTCTPSGKKHQVTDYRCDASVKLPRLTFEVGEWKFFLDPSEYTTPITGSSQVKVLTGDYPSMFAGWVFGAPFLRKYPLIYNTTDITLGLGNFDETTLYCIENTTCTKITPIPATSTPLYGGYGPGYGTGGGGGSSPTFGVDVEAKRKRNKLILTIGLSVGGFAFLAICGCVWKRCQSADGEAANQDGAKEKEDASVGLTVGVGATKDDSSDASDSDDDRKNSKWKARKVIAKQRKENAQKRSDGSYDSESSEESRRERRRRRRCRRERRREREQQQESETIATTATVIPDVDTKYVAASTPKGSL